jgi:hypothetical protein
MDSRLGFGILRRFYMDSRLRGNDVTGLRGNSLSPRRRGNVTGRTGIELVKQTNERDELYGCITFKSRAGG